MSLEVMKQALEALEQVKPLYTKQHAIAALRQAIEQAEKQEPLTLRAGDGDCRDAERICADLKAIEQAQKQEPWVWQQSPIKTQWGDDMVVADLAIDKDHTVSVYCERDQTARVEAMFNRGC